MSPAVPAADRSPAPPFVPGEDQEVVAAVVELQRAAAAELERLAAALGEVWRMRGAMFGSLDAFGTARQAGLLREFQRIDKQLRKVIDTGSALLEEGRLTDGQRLRLEFGAETLEAQYQSVQDLAEVVKA